MNDLEIIKLLLLSLVFAVILLSILVTVFLLRFRIGKVWMYTREDQWTYTMPPDCKHPLKMELTYLKKDET